MFLLELCLHLCCGGQSFLILPYFSCLFRTYFVGLNQKKDKGEPESREADQVVFTGDSVKKLGPCKYFNNAYTVHET